MQYFYKMRDRPLGPHSLAKMQELARRAQVGRKTPVSTDGLTWQAASDFPEIFSAAPPPPVTTPQGPTSEPAAPAVPMNQGSGSGGGLATTRFCSHCGAGVTEAAVICLSCGAACGTGLTQSGGAASAAAVDNGITNPNAMSPIAAGLLGFCCLPGLAQMMLGQVVKGLVLFLISLVLWPTIVGGLAVNVFSGIDAYQIAQKLKDGKTVGQWEFF
jgi:hypothetical protein